MRFERKKICILVLVFFMPVLDYGATKFNSAVALKHKKLGRFGDQLFCYYKAKLFSYVHKIPLLYDSPKASLLIESNFLDNLMLSIKEPSLQPYLKQFRNVVDLDLVDHDFVLKIENDTLYLLSKDIDLNRFGATEKVALDPEFLKVIKEMISPINSPDDVFRPQDKITVAIHVRKGGGFDQPLFSKYTRLLKTRNVISSEVSYEFSDIKFPKKFPPDSFYISQIKRIYKMFGRRELYIYMFTDDKDPQALIAYYRQQLKNVNMTMVTRQTEDVCDKNVIKDFFAMSKFDCLIRPVSAFSKMAELIGKHKIVIWPKKHKWENDKLIIHEVYVKTKGKIFIEKGLWSCSK